NTSTNVPRASAARRAVVVGLISLAMGHCFRRRYRQQQPITQITSDGVQAHRRDPSSTHTAYLHFEFTDPLLELVDLSLIGTAPRRRHRSSGNTSDHHHKPPHDDGNDRDPRKPRDTFHVIPPESKTTRLV